MNKKYVTFPQKGISVNLETLSRMKHAHFVQKEQPDKAWRTKERRFWRTPGLIVFVIMLVSEFSSYLIKLSNAYSFQEGLALRYG